MKPSTNKPEKPTSDEGVRLSKRVAALFSCSRSEAEHYIEGGWVSVDGVVVEMPQFRVLDQTVTLAADASLAPPPSITLLYHKPAGHLFGGDNVNSIGSAVLREITSANRASDDRSGCAMLQQHLARLTLPCPLEPAASGLVVLTQDGRITRKLIEDAKTIEQEIIVEVRENKDVLSNSGLQRLNFGLAYQGKPCQPMKVSWQNENRLRFAVKAPLPGQIEDMCKTVGLSVVSIKRIRIGRVPMAGLPVGQWRYLGDHERF